MLLYGYQRGREECPYYGGVHITEVAFIWILDQCKRSINVTDTRAFILYIKDSSHNIISYRKDNAGILNYDKQVYLTRKGSIFFGT